MFDCICMGSATVDAFASSNADIVKITTPDFNEELIAFASGSKILMNQLEFTVGGGGTNTAVSMSRLGLNVAFLGKIGMRNNAQFVQNVLKEEKVDLGLVSRNNSRTGFSVILDVKGKDRAILAFKGSNNDLTFKEINKKKLKTRWFYFASMMGESFNTMKKIASYAEKNNIKIAFNPSSYLCKKGKGFIKEILSKTEVLVLNKEEAELLVGKQGKLELLKELCKLGPRQAIVTDGKKGAYTIVDDIYYDIKPKKVKIIETTGAGDAFASAYVAAIIRGAAVEKALKIAVVNAQSVLQHNGAKNDLLTWSKAIYQIGKTGPRIIKKRL